MIIFSKRLKEWWTLVVLSLVLGTLLSCKYVEAGSEEDARKYLDTVEPQFNKICNSKVMVDWELGVNANEAAKKRSAELDTEFTKITLEIQNTVLKKFPNWKEFKDKKLRRAFKFLAVYGPGDFPVEKVDRMSAMVNNMSHAYSTATVCKYKEPDNCKIRLIDLERMMSSIRDPDEAAHYFTSWHDKMSALVTPQYYKEFIDLQTENAKAYGFKYQTEDWLMAYDDESGNWNYKEFEESIIKLEDQIQDLYEILHAYVRMKLRKMPEYANLIEKCGYIPAHITGNIWAQEWTGIEGITKPFPKAPAVDASEAMRKKGYTPKKMFEDADKFFQGLGLEPMTDKFWKNSIFERPSDGREMNCHATAWDTCMGKGNDDFRIRQCARVAQHDFVVAHHEMGHIAYFMHYKDLEFVFRTSANPGFHEALGDALALAVITPEHLQCKLELDLGFPPSLCQAKDSFNVTEADLNYLYLVALRKLVFFPFSTAVESWRWAVVQDFFGPDQYNSKWWGYRRKYQGVIPPTDRNSSKLFDASAKYHIVANVDYIRYFVAHIVQFQFYEAMCIAAKEFDPNNPKGKPLFQCDFSGSKEAGKKLMDMMRMGFAHGWPDALEKLTGSREMSIAPFKHYLQPILDYMEKEVKAAGESIGFGRSCEHAEERRKLRHAGSPKWDAT